MAMQILWHMSSDKGTCINASIWLHFDWIATIEAAAYQAKVQFMTMRSKAAANMVQSCTMLNNSSRFAFPTGYRRSADAPLPIAAAGFLEPMEAEDTEQNASLPSVCRVASYFDLEWRFGEPNSRHATCLVRYCPAKEIPNPNELKIQQSSNTKLKWMRCSLAISDLWSKVLVQNDHHMPMWKFRN